MVGNAVAVAFDFHADGAAVGRNVNPGVLRAAGQSLNLKRQTKQKYGIKSTFRDFMGNFKCYR